MQVRSPLVLITGANTDIGFAVAHDLVVADIRPYLSDLAAS